MIATPGEAIEIATDVCALPLARRLAAMLDRDPSSLREGDPLPRGWHTMLFNTPTRQPQLRHDGAAGLAKHEDFRADIVLLDNGLPRMDGYMVAHAIRERFALAGRRPKLLALTGYGRDDDKTAALKAGFDGHLAKPVDPARLLDIVAAQDESSLVSG